MTADQIIVLIFQISMGLIIFTVALNVRLPDIGDLLREPALLLRSLLAMNVIMPAIAVALAVLFEFRPALEVALIALALSPIPPFIPGKEMKAGGSTSYILGLLIISALLSIAYVPAVAELLGRTFGRPVHVSPGTVAKIMGITVLIPLAAGAVMKRVASAVAQRIARPVSMLGAVLLIAASLPVLIMEWPAVVSLIGDFTLIVIAVFVLAGLAVGHLLGGPDPDDRTVLALSTASRHPAVAMAIAHHAPDQKSVLAAVLLVLMVGGIVSAPYVKWRRRSHAHTAPHRAN